MISFQNVSKKFSDGTFGVVDINLEIPDNDFVFIVGLSGAGKTTLLKLLTAQTRATDGTIKIDDIDVTKLKASQLYKVRRKVGVVFQDFKLLADQTIYENIAMALDVIGQKEKNYKEIIHDLLHKVGLEGKEQYFPIQLSGGELQRTAIARALATKPEILVADEPTGDLDPTTAWDIINVLTEINANGTTVIMATHNHNIVDAMKKRVLTIDRGRITSDEVGGYTSTKSEEKKHDSKSHEEASHKEEK